MILRPRDCAVTVGRDAKVWRYIDLHKLERLLRTRSIWFSRADLLGDSFEGSLPQADIDARQQFFAARGDPESHDVVGRMRKDALQVNFVSCWHMNEHESDAMWSRYLRAGPGVAVMSTVGRLVDELGKSREPILVGQVQYVDFQRDQIHKVGLSLMHKQKSFEHERELRFWITSPHARDRRGLEVVCNIATVVEAIIVAPLEDRGLRDRVQGLVDEYLADTGSGLSVRASDLAREPHF